MTVFDLPPHARRSRSQRTADSAALILDAAVHGLVHDGYARSTTVSVQARASVSRGRLLHHFPSREDLLVAAAQHLAATHVAEMEQWIVTTPALTGRARTDLATEQMWRTFDRPYFWAAMELWTAARTDEPLRRILLPAEQRLGVAVRGVVDRMYGPALAAHALYQEVRELLFTSMRGVAVTGALEPRDPLCEPYLPMWQRTAARLLRRGT
jgi:Transcriptional regulator